MPQTTEAADVPEIALREPVVSIGMPVFNGEKYIRLALDALLSQTLTDFELIISDNASTDQTAEICEEYSKQDGRIRYYRQSENRGACENFTFVLTQSTGTFFMWAACDDEWAPNCLEKLVAACSEDIGHVYSLPQVINPASEILRNGNNSLFRQQVLRVHEKNSRAHNFLLYFIDRNTYRYYGLYRRNALPKEGLPAFLHSARHTDNILLLKVIARHKTREVPERLFRYRLHPKTSEYYSTDSKFKRQNDLLVQANVTLEAARIAFKSFSLPVAAMISCMLPALTFLMLARPYIRRILPENRRIGGELF